MIVGERVSERMSVLGLSQSELARRVGVAQPTIYKLIRSNKIGSKHLHRIARTLGTTPAYLEGETDDPDENAPPPPPAPIVQFVMMPVAWPSEDALAEMFEGFLEIAGEGLPQAALARELAQQLPIGLSALEGPLMRSARQTAASAPLEALAIADRGPPQ